MWVLGGRHICTALQKLQAEYLQAGKALPVWLSHVQCDMIKEDTKVSIKQQIAGDHNVVQHSSSSLRLPEIANGIWDELDAFGNVQEKAALLLALQKAGKLGKSACPVCIDVITIDCTLLACPMCCYYLLLCRTQYSRPGNLWSKAWWLGGTRSVGHSRTLRDRRGLKVCTYASQPRLDKKRSPERSGPDVLSNDSLKTIFDP